MNLSTNPFLLSGTTEGSHGIGKLCTICHMILKETDSSHSIFSTIEELESPDPMNVLQVLQSFSNFNFYNGLQMVCTMCYDKTIQVYKFIQMCNKAHESGQHYLKNIEDETNMDVKMEEICIEPTRIIVDGREFVNEMENEKNNIFDELGMVISGTEIKVEEIILEEDTSNNEEISEEGMEKQETDNKEAITTSHTEIVSEEKELDDHHKEAKHTKEKPFLIELRHALFGTKYNLRSHDQRHISKDWRQLIRIDSQPLKDHETDVVCPDCQEVFCNDKQLKIHMRRRHKKKFLCNDCGKVFTTKSHLNSHIRVHTEEKPFTCLICKRGFAFSSSLARHTRTHNEVKLKAHKCEQCDRGFTRAESLRDHMLIHNGVKAHKCEQCDRRFTQAAHLRTHLNVHNEVKPHKCERCDRQFTQASALRKHIRIHNGVKAHKCEQCDRRFTHATHLSRHMNRHKGIKSA